MLFNIIKYCGLNVIKCLELYSHNLKEMSRKSRQLRLQRKIDAEYYRKYPNRMRTPKQDFLLPISVYSKSKHDFLSPISVYSKCYLTYKTSSNLMLTPQ